MSWHFLARLQDSVSKRASPTKRAAPDGPPGRDQTSTADGEGPFFAEVPYLARRGPSNSAPWPEKSASLGTSQATNSAELGVWRLPGREPCATVVHLTYRLEIDEPIRTCETAALAQYLGILQGYLSRSLKVRVAQLVYRNWLKLVYSG